jgi:ubiquinone/menaquinone biosynthesis C-methylase UbiE
MRDPAGFRPLAGASWYKRAQAALIDRAGAIHSRLVDARKRALLAPLRGTVVEIGPGTGANLPYYDASVRWIGVEPNAFMHDYLEREATRLGRAVELREGRAESLPIPDASADAVVSTLVLCTVHDVDAALREVRRVLRPGGRFVFVEHVAARRGSLTRLLQRAVAPLWQAAGDGCHPDRETWRAIERAGFSELELRHFTLPVPVVGPHVAGVGVR